ncbi:hypothetical protein [Pseudonocardia charpentierae]|uniref:Peptidase family S51 n=1 Tax=Pseudonocardia charpentierae TaxID=3075545 RepID=A0ABU2NFA6_9PSEU|nr:hypothetical protein [Pseudonocardia sp. DSM 45834]MDT0352138.1 hypothetical protein [Pseudonocardia sp. DSM 45834]
MRAFVLGPQRRPTLGPVVGALDLAAPVSTVTAGWEEREPDDTELDALLGGRSRNLRLHARWQDVLARDPAYADAERQYRAALREHRALYQLRLDAALRGLREVTRYDGDDAVRSAARTDAEAVVRLVDEQHLARVREARASFEDTWRPGERDAVAEHRSAVSHLAGSASALVVTGGNVEVLLHVLRLFAVPAPPAVIAWSAGAMALTERVLLFHDRTPYSPSDAEFLDSGVGWLRGCVLLPHARRRLRTDDPVRMAELAARAAPARCVVLDDGVRLDLGSHGELPPDARVVAGDGHIGEVA